MSALADNPGTRPKPARLGEILIERGLVTHEQLEIALADQQISGNLLGAILIERGFVAPTTIAAALATQYGGLLKTEYGFATGFGPTLEPAPVAPPVASEVAPLRFSPELVGAPVVAAAPAQPEPAPAPAPVQAVPPPADALRVAEATPEQGAPGNAPDASSAEIERLLAENAKLAAQLVADREAWRTEIERLGAENKSLEGKLAELAQGNDGQAVAASAEIERLAAENASMAAKLTELTAERDAARTGPAAGNEGLAARLADVELLLARVTNRGATISERLDEVIGDVARLQERVGTDEAPSPSPLSDAG